MSLEIQTERRTAGRPDGCRHTASPLSAALVLGCALVLIAPGTALPETPPVSAAKTADDAGPAAARNVEPTWITEAWDVRSGWWALHTSGSMNTVLEFEDNRPAPFWDVDGLRSDGKTRLDLSLTGIDQEDSFARANYYDPRLAARLDYERYFRRTDHDPLANLPRTVGPNTMIVGEDLNAGEEYAIRVQQFKGCFKGPITDELKWRVNVWSMHRTGERQALAMSDAFSESDIPSPGPVAQVRNQVQHIDWVSTEVEPVVEGSFGPWNIEYSRPMRGFSPDDQPVSVFYTPFPSLPQARLEGDFPYDVVPEGYMERDQLKIGWDMTDDTKFYGFLYNGRYTDELRDIHRDVNGFDLRLTNRSMENVTLTGYGKLYRETNQSPSFYLPEEVDAEPIRAPSSWYRTRAGVKSVWRPHGGGYGLRGLAINLGYEYQLIDRITVQNPINVIDFSPTVRWSRGLDTWIRYRWTSSFQPLLGVTDTTNDLNTLMPSNGQRVELGGTVRPGNRLIIRGSVGTEQLTNHGPTTSFSNDRYPATVGGSYALTPQWSLTAGYSYLADFIDQDVRLGDEKPQTPGDGRLSPVLTRWSYYGRAQVVDFGTSWEANERVRLLGNVQWVQGHDTVGDLPLWPDLPGYSAVVVRETRLSTGVDWKLRERVQCYFRYIYDIYEDYTGEYNSGEANIFLAGISAIF